MNFTDQLNRTIFLPHPPKRIISLVPSQTELLVDLGLEDRIVGVTKFCVHPADLRKKKTIVGGTKNYRFDVIDSLQPDLIIGNKEENDQVGIEKLASKYPVWMSDILTVEDSLRMILELGKITDTLMKAEEIVNQLKVDLNTPVPYRGTAVYLIWNDPIMVAGQDTFINEMLLIAGFKNLIETSRYPEIVSGDLQALDPDYLLLSSEPFPFKEKHLSLFKILLPNASVRIVDGELFSWYGTRLLKTLPYFKSL
jgi:ABC-type Fe3+-hydroxamate transport system substrate-binding protein